MADKNSSSKSFDSGKQYIGGVYAKALLGAAQSAGTTEAMLAEFDSLLSDVLDKMPKFEETLASLRVSHAEKVRLLDLAFSGKMSTVLLNFLKITSSHGRLDCLRAINQIAHRLYNEMLGRIEVTIQTAEPVDAALLSQISDRLTVVLGGQLELDTEIDPDLIGGLVVRIGDTVYDASIANRLERLREETYEKTSQVFRQSLDRYLTVE